MRRSRIAAVLAIVAVGVALFAAPAPAASRAPLQVSPTQTARATGGPFLCCRNRNPPTANPSGEVRPPTHWTSPAQCRAAPESCDATSLRVSTGGLATPLLRVAVEWRTTGLQLAVALWRTDGRREVQLEGTYAHNVAPVDGSDRALALVHDPEPLTGSYTVVVEHAGGVFAQDLSGYSLSASIVRTSTWPLDADAAGAASAAAPAEGAPTSEAADSESSDGALPLAERLVGLRTAGVDRPVAVSAVVGVPGVLVLLAVLALAIAIGVVLLRRRQRASVSAAAWRFRDTKLIWKLLFPFVAVIVAIASVSTYLTVRYVADRANTELDRSLLENAVQAESFVRDTELYLLEAERYAANVEGVVAVTQAKDKSQLTSVLASAVAVRRNLDVLAITDADGTGLVEFVRTGDSFAPQSGADWSAAAAVREVLAGRVDAVGDKRTSVVELRDGTTLLVTCGPIQGSTLVGTAVAGTSLPSLVATIARRTGSDAALYDVSGQRLATSKGSQSPERIPTRFVSGGPTRELRGDNATLYTPVSIRGASLGVLALTQSAAAAREAAQGAALRLGLVAAAAMLAVVLVGVALSRHIVRSVDALVSTSRALGDGNLAARSEVLAGDELGELAVGLNAMADQLQASYENLEARVEDRTIEVQRLLEERTSFFASISHELRTPIAVILGQAAMIDSPTAQILKDAGNQLLGFVNDILEIARAETGRLELHPAEVDFGDLMDGLEPAILSLANVNKLTVAIEVPAELPRLWADEARLRQIILDLVDNAVKYTAPGGRVSISAHQDAADLTIRVSDTGVGFAPEVGERLFEPFYRVAGVQTQGGQPSSGLGLAVVKHLVEAHGGRIWFTSAPDEGSTFSFTIPLDATALVSAASADERFVRRLV